MDGQTDKLIEIYIYAAADNNEFKTNDTIHRCM